MSKKKILVTGGAGYIGSHIVLELNRLGYKVLVVDDMTKGNSKNLFKENEFIEGEIQDPKVLKKVFSEEIFAVFHFAAWKAAGESMTHPEKYTLNNLNGTFRLLTAMIENNCMNFIFSSSAAVYGAPRYLPVDENHPKSPENYYGYTKLCIEENLVWYDKLKDLKFAALRYFNAAGYDVEGRILGLEKTPANLLPIIMEVAVGERESLQIYGGDYDTEDGTCIRDYIHVSDLASAHVLALDYIAKEKKSIAVNLGSENGFSVLEMAELARKITNRPIPQKIVERRPGDPSKLLASSKMAQELLNWKPRFSSAETLLESMWKV